MKATKARGIGKQYVQLLWGYDGLPIDAGWTNETAPPYRYGHCVVRRLGPLRVAYVRGHWVGQHPGPDDLHQELVRGERDPEGDLTLLADLLGVPDYHQVEP